MRITKCIEYARITMGIFFFVLLYSCDNESSKIENTQYILSVSQGLSDVSTSIVTTELNHQLVEFYDIFNVKEYDDSLLFVGYNNIENSLDFFQIRDSVFLYLKSLNFEEEGPNSLVDVEAVCILDTTIAVLESYRLKFIAYQGGVVSTVRLEMNEYQSIAHNKGGISSFQNKLLTGAHNVDVSKSKETKKYFETNFLGLLNVTNGKQDVINLKFPDVYREKYFGFLDIPNLTRNGNKIVYTFPADNDVYLYNLAKKELVTVVLKPIYMDSDVPSLKWPDSRNTDLRLDHYVRSPMFSKSFLLEDSLLVRLYRDEFPINDSDVSYPLRKKNVYLTVADLKRNLYQDYSLPENNISLNSAFNFKNEIWIPFFIEEEGISKFLRVQIKLSAK